MKREPLPNRRASRGFSLRYGTNFDVSIGFFADGRPAEVFVSSVKVGTDIQSLSRDGAILISLALQYGAPLDVMRKAISRGANEEAQSIIGALVDAVDKEVSVIAAEAVR